ncbi:MAG: hypothetical protein M3067_15115, partial [Chloroflexota bacterium]|nr:hypothetical protein [Chloroflexota bacterium]MDQ6910966.1 hypothetical protein [Actinomycetota bacterium]
MQPKECPQDESKYCHVRDLDGTMIEFAHLGDHVSRPFRRFRTRARHLTRGTPTSWYDPQIQSSATLS